MGPVTGQTTGPSPKPAADWGRVDDDGTVFVRIGDGELAVGQYPAGSPEEALGFFTRRFEALEFEVSLLEQRIRNGTLSPDEALAAIEKVRPSTTEPHSVGDLVGLCDRLDALKPLVAAQREQRKVERAAKAEHAKTRKSEIAAEAEAIATGTDWRNGAVKLRELLDEWKALPRLDRASDDALWHRFSTARTAYTKARKTHFAAQDERREAARVIKEKLAKKAEELASSTDWGPTSGVFRDLMRDWKAAGAAPRAVEDALWQRFRGAQDAFFAARDAANAVLDKEFAANADVKRAILEKAEALLPITDLSAAKRAFRDLADKWDAAGKVPRDQISSLEGRMRKVEQAIRSLEDDQWRKSDPEKSARADDMVAKLREGLAKVEKDLEKAQAAGDAKRAAKLEDEIESRKAFLAMAEKTAAEFSR